MAFNFSEFKTRFPELAGVDEAFYNAAKSSAELSVNTAIWNGKVDEGVKLMTAHIISLSGRNGASGPLKREKVGDLEREYVSINTNLLSSTSYGAEFQRHMNSLITSPLIC